MELAGSLKSKMTLPLAVSPAAGLKGSHRRAGAEFDPGRALSNLDCEACATQLVSIIASFAASVS